jgi:hypothetical protein
MESDSDTKHAKESVYLAVRILTRGIMMKSDRHHAGAAESQAFIRKDFAIRAGITAHKNPTRRLIRVGAECSVVCGFTYDRRSFQPRRLE